jgi:HK97 family phage major capsid protein
MAFTKRSDLVIVTEILQAAVKGQLAGMRVFDSSPACVINGSLGSSQGGDTIKIPYFGTLGELDDLAAEGDALTPASLSQTSETATVSHSGKAFEATQWAILAADPRSDPYVEGARQIGESTRRRVDKALIDVAVATDAPMTVDVYNASTPRNMDYDLFLSGRRLWGDEQDDIVGMVVHSKVLFDMYGLRDSTGRPLLIDMADGGQPRFLGIPVKVSDRLTATADSPAKYTSLILKRNALAFWYNAAPTVYSVVDPAADTRLTYTHIYWAAHRYSRLPGSTKSGVVILKHN